MTPSPLFRTPMVVLDTETTGLLSDPEARPWEIGAVLLDRCGREVSHLDVAGMPELWHDRMARPVEMGGFTVHELLGLRPLATRLREVRAWMGLALAIGARITAFNVSFDRAILARIGLVWPEDRWARCIQQEVGGAALWSAAQVWGVQQVQPEHRALSDARTAAHVMVALQRARWRL